MGRGFARPDSHLTQPVAHPSFSFQGRDWNLGVTSTLKACQVGTEYGEGLTMGVTSVLVVLQLAHRVCPTLRGQALHTTARPTATTFCAIGAEPLCPSLGARNWGSQHYTALGEIPSFHVIASFSSTAPALNLLIFFLFSPPTRYSCPPQDIFTCCSLILQCSSFSLLFKLFLGNQQVQFKGHYFFRKTFPISLTRGHPHSSGYLLLPRNYHSCTFIFIFEII